MTTVEPIRNKSDIKKVEKVLAQQSQRDLMLFVLGTNCGLRISDLLSLNVGDVRNKTHIQIVEKKTGKFKKFPINDRLKPMIEDFVKGRRNAEPFVFISLAASARQSNCILFNSRCVRKSRTSRKNR